METPVRDTDCICWSATCIVVTVIAVIIANDVSCSFLG